MIEVRSKDKVFLAIALPMVVAGLYFWWVRPAEIKKLDVLKAQDRVTVTEAEYPSAKRIAEKAEKEALAKLESERAIPLPAPKVVGKESDAPAVRTRAVVENFRKSGVRVVSSAVVEENNVSRSASVLKVTGIRHLPLVRAYAIEGDFRSLCAALHGFEKAKMPVIVDSVASEGGNRWRVRINE
jgi:hypothetical protein